MRDIARHTLGTGERCDRGVSSSTPVSMPEDSLTAGTVGPSAVGRLPARR